MRFRNLKPGIILLFITLTVCGLLACDDEAARVSDLNDMIAGINKKCPQMIDSETRLDSIQLKSNHTLSYYYTLVHVIKQNVDTLEFYNQLWPGILSGIRVSPEMQSLREQSMNFEYQYRDRSNEFIYNFKISPKDYQLKKD
jgi:hypothetical protein